MSQPVANSFLDAALSYRARGWSIIPIGGDKKPIGKWIKYQTELPTEDDLEKLFKKSNVKGLAVICGAVSGNLVARDFDDMDAYKRWAEAHPDLAKTLPTVKTARGRHVYFISPIHHYHDEGDGEYRGDNKHYTILPPSIHPDGPVYEWLIPLPDGELPFIDDPVSAGLLGNGTEPTEPTEPFEPTNVIYGSEMSLEEFINDAISKTLPESLGHRNDCAFKFARALKFHPQLFGADVGDLIPHLRRWHERALPTIGTEYFDDTLYDFLRGMENARLPLCDNALEIVLERAERAGTPPEAEQFENPQVRRLAALCKELQRFAGDKPFFLSRRTAARLLDKPLASVDRWMSILEFTKLLDVTKRGCNETKKANRFRYMGESL